MISVQEQALQNYVPRITDKALYMQNDMGALIDRLVQNCPETLPGTTWNPIQTDDLYNVYFWILTALQQAPYGEAEATVSLGIMDGLNTALRRDRARKSISGRGISIYSQHLFRALAEVASEACSLPLSRILQRFFLEHATYIASYNRADALGQWCYSLLRVSPRQAMDITYACFEKVLRVRPELGDRLADCGTKGQYVAQHLERLTGRSIGNNLLQIGSELDDDGWGYVGSGHTSSRGRALSYSRVGDRRDLVRDAEDMIRDGEREIQRGRRMLRLAMGSRYASRGTRQGLITDVFDNDYVDNTVIDDDRYEHWPNYRGDQEI